MGTTGVVNHAWGQIRTEDIHAQGEQVVCDAPRTAAQVGDWPEVCCQGELANVASIQGDLCPQDGKEAGAVGGDGVVGLPGGAQVRWLKPHYFGTSRDAR